MTAAELRKDLKSHSISNRAVSVQQDGTSIRVLIKKDVSYKLVASLAANYEKIYRDDSGDILDGGNTFVDIEVNDGVIEPTFTKILEEWGNSLEVVFQAGAEHWVITKEDPSIADKFAWFTYGQYVEGRLKDAVRTSGREHAARCAATAIFKSK